MAIQIPEKADIIEAEAKYIIVRDTILPFIRAFKLAETVTRLPMSIGNVTNFNILINSSPGYEINMMVSLDKLYGRNVIPEKLLVVWIFYSLHCYTNVESILKLRGHFYTPLLLMQCNIYLLCKNRSTHQLMYQFRHQLKLI